MYIPSSFRVDDQSELVRFIQQHSFATLVTSENNVPFATHLPVQYDAGDGDGDGSLLLHLARANPQWRHFSASEVLVIFQGPHTYVSPNWYNEKESVPTWNYTAVHAYGTANIVTDHDRIVSMLSSMVATYEQGFANPWTMDISNEYRDKMIAAIVVVEIKITRLEGKFKLSQNRPEADIQSVIKHLEQSPRHDDQELAKFMTNQKEQSQ